MWLYGIGPDKTNEGVPSNPSPVKKADPVKSFFGDDDDESSDGDLLSAAKFKTFKVQRKSLILSCLNSSNLPE